MTTLRSASWMIFMHAQRS